MKTHRIRTEPYEVRFLVDKYILALGSYVNADVDAVVLWSHQEW